MTRSRFVAAGLAVTLVACGGAGGEGKDDASDVPPKSSKGDASDADRAVDFAAATGAKPAETIDWSTVVMARGLASLTVMAGLSPADRAALVEAAGGKDPIAGAVKTLASVDYRQEGQAAAAQFSEHYAGVAGCKATKPAEPPLSAIGDAVVEQLTPELKAALHRVKAGAAFELTCGEETGMVVFGEGGSVIAFEPPTSNTLSPDVVDGEKKFVDYMTQPDE